MIPLLRQYDFYHLAYSPRSFGGYFLYDYVDDD